MKVNISYIIIACLMAIVCAMGFHINNLNERNERIEQNYKAAQDSIKILYMDNEYLLYEKDAYILKESELQDQININQEEIKEIKKKLKTSIDYISKIDGLVKVDTIYMNDTIYYKDSIPTIHFGYKDDWLTLNGSTTLLNNTSKTSIHNIQVPILVETGLTEDYNIFVKTNNPYVTIQNIDGAIIKDRKFNIDYHHELQVGIGFQYGLFNNQIDFGPQIGYGFIIEF